MPNLLDIRNPELGQAFNPVDVKVGHHRFKTERVDAVLHKTIEGENLDLLLNGLTPEEQNLFYELVGHLREAGDLDLDDLWKVDYVKRPPTMEEFLEEDYWLAAIARKSDESEGVFPVWKEILCRDFNLDSRLHNTVITGSLGVGKCLRDGTLVMMHDGSTRKVEDIKVGDKLMGDDSTPRTVINTVSGSEDLYEIRALRPTRSDVWACTGDHVLCLKHSDGEVLEITVNEYIRRKGSLGRWKLYRVPVEFPSQQVKIDPYWLGLWLGDGSSHAPSITIAHQDTEILDYHTRHAESRGLVVHEIGIKEKCSLYNSIWGHDNTDHPKQNPINVDLRHYDLLNMPGTPSRKRIPSEYIFNTRAVRQAVLAGLVDSDGSLCRPGCYGIGTKFKHLADQIVQLSRSLGYMACIAYKKVKCQTRDNIDSWVVTISGAYDLPVLLPRKKSPPVSPNKRRSTSVTGFSIKPVGPGSYHGFELDGNRRFLLADFTVTHNSFVTALIFAYRLAQACLLRNPQAFLGLSKGSMVYYVMLSVTRAQVTETIFGDILNLMGNCPFFQEECGYDPKKKYAGMNVPLGRNIFLTAGSQSQHIVGRNTLGVAMDEGNWRREKNPNKSAYKLFDEVRTRLKNRFQKVAGYLPAISILASSARDESSFTEQVIKDIEAVKNPSTEKVYRLAAFEVKRHKLVLSKRWFKVAYGVRNQDPRVLGGWFDEAGVLEPGSTAEEVPAGAQIRMVPFDYIDAFKRNVTTALQSICGVSTGGSFRLFGNMADFERAAINAEQSKLENPCNVQSISLSVEDEKQIWDFLDHKKLVARRAGTFTPLRDPDRLRYAHIDLATATQAGVSICHTADTRKIDGLYDRHTGRAFSEFRPVIEYDLVLSLVAGVAKPISFEKIQNLFFWLRDRCGFRFGLITADTFQSSGSLQILESRGFAAKVLSLDRTKEPYYSWREGFIEGRVRLFKHSILWHESEHLIDGSEKIDHNEQNSKDVSDSAAGAYFNAFKAKESGSTNHTEPAIHGGSAEPVSDDPHGMTSGLTGTQPATSMVRRFGG